MQIRGAIRRIESRNRPCVCGNIIYDKGGMLNHNSSEVIGQLGIHLGKMLDLYDIQKLIPDEIKTLILKTISRRKGGVYNPRVERGFPSKPQNPKTMKQRS